MRATQRVLATLTFLVSLATGLSAADRDVYQASAGERSVVLIAEAGATWIQEGTSLRAVQLPADSWLNRIKLTESGWVAGGTRAFDDGQDLLLMINEAGATRVATLPGARTSPIRQGVVPLVEKGTLVGIAWLEGDDLEQVAVYAAQWTGDSWGTPELVSPPTPGGQVALSGEVLANGSWILVWSRFDGEDTETVWSRRSGPDEWRPFEAVHEPNSVPDLTPAVIAIDDRALVAWSWYDGDTLRQRLSRLEGNEWIDTGFRGPAASIYPSFLEGPLGPRLLFQTIVPRGWTVVQLSRNGRPGLSASVGEASHTRPALFDDEDELRFTWPAPASEISTPERRVSWETDR